MSVLAALRWFLSVGLKIFRVVPVASSLGVVATLTSQVASILAALLPLKVIILLGSERIPGYFPAAFQAYEKAYLIIGLGGAALVFFVVHLVTEQLISRLSVFGAQSLIKNSRKLAMFESQEQLLSKAYKRFSAVLAGAVFSCIALFALVWVYPLQAWMVSAYCLVVLFVLPIILRLKHAGRVSQNEDVSRTVGVLANIGFYLVFAAIVADVFMGSTISLLWAIVALLLTRQLFRRLATVVTDITTLYSQRLQLNALLFHGHVYAGKAVSDDAKGLWSLAEPDTSSRWLIPLVQRLVGSFNGSLQVRWVQSGIPDILMCIVSIDTAPQHRYLVKLFGKNRGALSRHEAALFAAMTDRVLPLPRLCLVDQVESFNCHLFHWPMVGPIEPQAVKREALTVLGALWCTPPSPALVALFARSRPMLWQRLDDKQVARLRLFVCPEGSASLARFSELFTSIKVRLEAMPLAIVSSELSADGLWVDHQGLVWASHWGRWTLEPLGGGWPVNEKSLPLLVSAFERAQHQRADLLGVNVKQVELAALMHAFDKACQRQAYRNAFELIDPVLEIYDAISD